MNDPKLPPSDVLTEQSSPGEMLRHGRQALELTHDEVAAALNLRPAVIRGLENDQYDEVPIAIYRRGYLRSYANLLGLDPDPVLAAYRARNTDETAEPKAQPLQLQKRPSSIGTWLFRLMTLAVIVGLIGLTLLWWQSRGGNQPPDPSASEPVAVDSRDGTITIADTQDSSQDTADNNAANKPSVAATTRAADEQAAANASREDSASDATTDAPAATDQSATDQSVAEGSAQAAEQVATETAESADQTADEDAEDTAQEAAQANPNLLYLVFNQESWTEVTDANGKKIFVGLQKPGTEANIEGEPPYRMTVGNATGVEMTWRGKTVNVSTHAGANNVARFTLGE